MARSNASYARQPFQEAIAFLAQKQQVDTNTYRDVTGIAHDAAFVVAGAKGTLLNDLHQAVNRAIADGETLAEFKSKFNGIVAQRGWSHTGNRDWRAAIIWRSNLRAAYAAGRIQRQEDPDVQRLRPFRQWVHGGTRNPRHSHLAMNGKVLRSDDPFWQTSYPPVFLGRFEYGCRCQVYTLSARDVDREGLTVETAPDLSDRLPFTDADGNSGTVQLPQQLGPSRAPGRTTAEERAQLLEQITQRLHPTLAQQVRDAVEALPLPSAVVSDAFTFPDQLDGLEELETLGGSTGAKLVHDPTTGQRYVLKRGNSPDHIREEFYADQAYEALGIPVPKTRLYETADGPVKLAEFIDGESLDTILSTGGEAASAAKAELQKHFAADALLANWDVVGLSADNVILRDGIAYRIDNGGALRFRAQGAAKAAQFNRYPDELWTLRNSRNSASAAFEDMSFKAAMEQVGGLNIEALKAALPEELHEIVQGRYDEMVRLADISRTMFDDRWKEGYVDSFTRHIIGIRQAGISDAMPQKLQWTGKGTTVYDENGKAFDDLRSGEEGLVQRISDYINDQGGDYAQVSSWMAAQAGDSWNARPTTLKRYITQQRNAELSEYWWKRRIELVAEKSDPFITDIYATTMQAHHAFQYELMDNINFDGRNTKNKTVRLIRTEHEEVMQLNKLKPGDTGRVISRGPIESTSIYQRVQVFGSELTVQEVPYHRIFGNYFAERSPGYGDGAFMGDQENEFVAMLEGIPFDYIAPKDWKPPKNSLKPKTANDPFKGLSLNELLKEGKKMGLAADNDD